MCVFIFPETVYIPFSCLDKVHSVFLPCHSKAGMISHSSVHEAVFAIVSLVLGLVLECNMKLISSKRGEQGHHLYGWASFSLNKDIQLAGVFSAQLSWQSMPSL